VIGESGPSPALQLTANPDGARVWNDFASQANGLGFGGPSTTRNESSAAAQAALAGSNRDVVANRAAIRMANLSAADRLKAEMAGLMPVKPKRSSSPSKSAFSALPVSDAPDAEVPGLGSFDPPQFEEKSVEMIVEPPSSLPETESNTEITNVVSSATGAPRGTKRLFEEAKEDLIDPEHVGEDEDEEEITTTRSLALKVNADGTVEQEDTVRYALSRKPEFAQSLPSFRLWESGYKERYYQQKFGVKYTDVEFRKR